MDGFCASVDNCPAVANMSQTDGDMDGVGDLCDNCSAVANAGQENADGDLAGDACDTCTDTDGDGFGDPGFAANICATDNCPMISNPAQSDTDADGLGDVCDACPDDADNDVDGDGVCGDVDNCPNDPNPLQEDIDTDMIGDACDTDIDGDGLANTIDNCPSVPNSTQADGDFDLVGNDCDNCPLANNPGQGDMDADGQGDACDPCPADPDDDIDNDTLCADVDNCPLITNEAQEDADIDGVGDPCDVCPTDPDLDGDDVCNDDFVLVQLTKPSENVLIEFGGATETVLVEFGSVIKYLANNSDPGLGITWKDEMFDDSMWPSGTYGVGYEVGAGGVTDLVNTTVPVDTYSVYTRATFNIADITQVTNLFIGADYDDGYIAYINGVEVFRSPQMPATGDPAWDTNASLHESSNGSTPEYRPLTDISLVGISELKNGVNVLAVGVWNSAAPNSSDMVLVPKLSMNRVNLANMKYLANNADPGLGITWKEAGFNDASWTDGSYGVGYELATGAQNLIQTPVPSDTRSVYTRATFEIANVLTVQNMFIGADYDDGWAAWINGVEVYRSVEMPFGTDPDWDTTPLAHESSNGAIPNYSPEVDISLTGIPALVSGTNVIAIGIWGNQPAVPPSSDLVLVPKLAINRTTHAAGDQVPGEQFGSGPRRNLGRPDVRRQFVEHGFLRAGLRDRQPRRPLPDPDNGPQQYVFRVHADDVQRARHRFGQPRLPRCGLRRRLHHLAQRPGGLPLSRGAFRRGGVEPERQPSRVEQRLDPQLHAVAGHHAEHHRSTRPGRKPSGGRRVERRSAVLDRPRDRSAAVGGRKCGRQLSQRLQPGPTRLRRRRPRRCMRSR